MEFLTVSQFNSTGCQSIHFNAAYIMVFIFGEPTRIVKETSDRQAQRLYIKCCINNTQCIDRLLPSVTVSPLNSLTKLHWGFLFIFFTCEPEQPFWFIFVNDEDVVRGDARERDGKANARIHRIRVQREEHHEETGEGENCRDEKRHLWTKERRKKRKIERK